MKQYIFLVGGFLLGILVMNIVSAQGTNENNNKTVPSPTTQSISHEDHDEMSMEDMVDNLRGKSGDEFDKAFIEGMIEHHEGAIEMAELAKLYAGHDEIKQLAEEIVSAQKKEIDQMKQWKTEWKY